ncbi:hypothetical protein SERLADRAFT_456697, partial [Serpula lacrymans var. lacrymans S7.9]
MESEITSRWLKSIKARKTMMDRFNQHSDMLQGAWQGEWRQRHEDSCSNYNRILARPGERASALSSSITDMGLGRCCSLSESLIKVFLYHAQHCLALDQRLIETNVFYGLLPASRIFSCPATWSSFTEHKVMFGISILILEL